MTRKGRNLLFWILSSVGLITCLVIAFPVLSSVYMEQKLRRFVKIEMIYPGCEESRDMGNATRCECEFIFEGVTDPLVVSFSNPGLLHAYDSQRRLYRVKG